MERLSTLNYISLYILEMECSHVWTLCLLYVVPHSCLYQSMQIYRKMYFTIKIISDIIYSNNFLAILNDQKI